MKNENVQMLSSEQMLLGKKNRVAAIGLTILNVILAIAYLIEVFKGERALGDYFIVFVLTIGPTILLWSMFIKNKYSKTIQYVGIWSFTLFYAYVMLTTDKLLVFCYVLLVMSLFTVYENKKNIMLCSIVALLINIIAIVKIYATGQGHITNTTEVEICIACILLMGCFATWVTTLNEQYKLVQLNQEKEGRMQIETLLQTVLEAAESIDRSIKVLTTETNSLEDSVENTKVSMEDLARGANNTAQAIQIQQEKTGEISQHISTLSKITDSITQSIQFSEELVTGSQVTMENLLNQVEKSEAAGKQVAKEMDELKGYTNQMQNIMTLINDVATQTSLLSLNASIEAARAGEAGRGFAVVAAEISNLASQTSQATGDINHLIQAVLRSLEEVVQAIENLMNSNQTQTGYVNDTAKELSQISAAVNNILESSVQMSKMVDTVTGANTIIVDSIQNISASTEQITEKASETLTSSEDNLRSVEKVMDTVEELRSYAQKLSTNKE